MCRRPFCCSAAGASVISGRFFCRLRRWLMGFCMVFAVKNFCQRRSGRFFSAQKEVGRYHRCWFSNFQTPLAFSFFFSRPSNDAFFKLAIGGQKGAKQCPLLKSFRRPRRLPQRKAWPAWRPSSARRNRLVGPPRKRRNLGTLPPKRPRPRLRPRKLLRSEGYADELL